MLRIFTKQAFEFRDSEGKMVQAKYNEFSELPDWVEKTPTYQLGVKDGLIVAYGNKTVSTETNKPAEENKPAETNKQDAKPSTNTKK
ncbi:hypothetical protein [Clostridium sp. BJN0013]|jgi:hypothetical protein|uniref:hypothetical protein n=1 Tax=Clostridium sp. BJN0013 TaxID=3236840 RepID=UPI0034C6925A